jgi:hypothetical protein
MPAYPPIPGPLPLKAKVC